jgi:signal transduction histidine kinase/ligand-binding sensor domain-containing protein
MLSRMMVIRLALTLVLLMLTGMSVHAAEAAEAVKENMLWRNWTTREGLPQDRIRAMIRTRDGYLWLGTDAGLARFDGFEFKTYGLHEGLGAVTVLSLLEGSDGTLWAGTLGGGITALRDGKVLRTYTRADGLPNDSISRLAEDGEGRLWAGERGMVARLAGDRFEPVPGMPDVGSGWLQTMFLSRDGVLWLSFSGPRVWTWQGGTWSAVKQLGNTLPTSFGEDADGRLWMGDGRGALWCRDNGEWRVIPVQGGATTSLTSISLGPDGTLWLTWRQRGLQGLRKGKTILPVTDGSPFAGTEDRVLATPDGLLWLGSVNRGLFALSPERLQVAIIDEHDRPGANTIGGLVEEVPGDFLIGTQGRGLYRMREQIVEPVIAEPQVGPSTTVNCMVSARDGGVWVGTGTGLTCLRGQTSEPVKGELPGWLDVWEVCEDRGGLWFGTGAGHLYRVDEGVARHVDFGYDVPVKGMAVQSDGTLWVGTRGRGLFAKVPDGGWKSYGKEQGLLSPVVRVIYASRDGDIWVGTAGGGLAVKRGERFFPVTTRDGLPDDTISQIHEGPTGRLWIGTHRGLAVLSVEEVARIKAGQPGRLYPRVIDRFDGLLSEEFTIVPPVATSDGRWAFGTTRGFVLLKPEDFQADRSVPPVLLQEVLVDGRAIAVKDGTVEVPPGAMRVEFRYTGLHFAAPDRLRFSTRLSGLEQDWGEPGTERTAIYRNVAPGDYRFEVGATAGNGLWTPKPAEVRVLIRPHVWQTGWFRAAVVLLALGAVVFIVRRREQLRSASRIQQLERQQAVEGERARIARDLHDDVGASLTQVALLSQLARSNLTKRPEKAGQHVQQIFDTAKEVTRALDEIVWAVNPQNDTVESFALFLGAFVQNYSHAAGLRCRIDVPESLPGTSMESAVRHHLYLATKEILHNVAKHADAHEIHFSLALDPAGFRLTIADDGRGFDHTETGKLEADGLDNLQSRLSQLGGTCTRRSAPGQGTTVEMNLPLTALGGG